MEMQEQVISKVCSCFSWDEHAKYDIPAMIDHVCKTTGQDRIQYIGHSMGVTAFIGALNEHPSLAGKIKMAHFMAPVVYLSGLKTKYGHFMPILNMIQVF